MSKRPPFAHHQINLGAGKSVGNVEIVERPFPRLLVFMSYAPPDEPLRFELHEHLSNLERQRRITRWHAGVTVAGTDAAREAGERLDLADVILILVSASYMDSDECYDRELMRAMDRHRANQSLVIPVLLRPCDWTGAPFAALQPLPTNGRPVTTWANRDEAWTDVALGIRRAIEELHAGGTS
jgi:hypothetical protein